MRAVAEGIRTAIKGHLAGSEMARRDWQLEGRVPLHKLRADMDDGVSEALTTYGRIGAKTWINRRCCPKEKWGRQKHRLCGRSARRLVCAS